MWCQKKHLLKFSTIQFGREKTKDFTYLEDLSIYIYNMYIINIVILYTKIFCLGAIRSKASTFSETRKVSNCN